MGVQGPFRLAQTTLEDRVARAVVEWVARQRLLRQDVARTGERGQHWGAARPRVVPEQKGRTVLVQRLDRVGVSLRLLGGEAVVARQSAQAVEGDGSGQRGSRDMAAAGWLSWTQPPQRGRQ